MEKGRIVRGKVSKKVKEKGMINIHRCFEKVLEKATKSLPDSAIRTLRTLRKAVSMKRGKSQNTAVTEE